MKKIIVNLKAFYETMPKVREILAYPITLKHVFGFAVVVLSLAGVLSIYEKIGGATAFDANGKATRVYQAVEHPDEVAKEVYVATCVYMGDCIKKASQKCDGPYTPAKSGIRLAGRGFLEKNSFFFSCVKK